MCVCCVSPKTVSPTNSEQSEAPEFGRNRAPKLSFNQAINHWIMESSDHCTCNMWWPDSLDRRERWRFRGSEQWAVSSDDCIVETDTCYRAVTPSPLTKTLSLLIVIFQISLTWEHHFELRAHYWWDASSNLLKLEWTGKLDIKLCAIG